MFFEAPAERFTASRLSDWLEDLSHTSSRFFFGSSRFDEL
tara:strand:+ start:17595 stop:17714 length:120 start_codon:yes stop_codon:yes gene_type:complete